MSTCTSWTSTAPDSTCSESVISASSAMFDSFIDLPYVLSVASNSFFWPFLLSATNVSEPSDMLGFTNPSEAVYGLTAIITFCSSCCEKVFSLSSAAGVPSSRMWGICFSCFYRLVKASLSSLSDWTAFVISPMNLLCFICLSECIDPRTFSFSGDLLYCCDYNSLSSRVRFYLKYAC